jgi:glycosyltransferase involved in cell wall biosynthesis
LESKKILSIIDIINFGGPARGIIQVATYLKEKKSPFSMVVASFNYLNRQDKRNEFVTALDHAGVERVLINERFPFDPLQIQEAFRIHRELRPDIVQTHGYKSHLLGLFLKLRFRVPWIAMTHGFTKEGKRLLLYNQVELLLLRWPDIVITVSPQLTKAVNRFRSSSKPTHYIKNAVSQGLIPISKTLPERSSSLTFGVFGRFSPEKGQEIFIEAFALLLKSETTSDVEALLAGAGNSEPLKTLARKLGVFDRIKFLPFVEKIGDLHHQIDVLVIPSLSEGLPNVLLEAMSFKKAVIASKVGAIPEVIEDKVDGILVEPGSVEALKEQLEILVLDSKLRCNLGEKAHHKVMKDYSVEARGLKFETLYQELLGAVAFLNYPV